MLLTKIIRFLFSLSTKFSIKLGWLELMNQFVVGINGNLNGIIKVVFDKK